jgi:hypothetical protein
MGFFDAARVAPAPAPPGYRLPGWLAPPENIEPVTVLVDLVLASAGDLTLSIAQLTVFPTGLSFELTGRGYARATHPLFDGPPLIDGGLAFGVLFADGRTAIANLSSLRKPLLERPDAPVLRTVSGGCGGGECRTSLWLWPLPPPGPLEFVCEWALEGIPETGASIDGAQLAAAAARCRELWRDDRDLPPTEDDVVI